MTLWKKNGMNTLDTQQLCAVSLCAVTKAFITVPSPAPVPASESTHASHKRSLFMFHMALTLKKRDRKKSTVCLLTFWEKNKVLGHLLLCCSNDPRNLPKRFWFIYFFIIFIFIFFFNTLGLRKVNPSTSTVISNGFQINASVASPLCRFFLYTVGAETIKSLSRHLSSPSRSLSVIPYLFSLSPSN